MVMGDNGAQRSWRPVDHLVKRRCEAGHLEPEDPRLLLEFDLLAEHFHH